MEGRKDRIRWRRDDLVAEEKGSPVLTVSFFPVKQQSHQLRTWRRKECLKF